MEEITYAFKCLSPKIESGVCQEKYICALDTEQGEVTSESRSWERFSGGHGREFILEG